MRLNELRKEDMVRANGLYEWYMEQNMYYKGDLGTFVEDYLERCEECGELYFSDDINELNNQQLCGDCYDETLDALRDTDEIDYTEFEYEYGE